MKRTLVALTLLSALAAPVAAEVRIDLRGSRASIRRQHEVAEELDLTFLRTAAQVREFVEKERLEQVTETPYLDIAKVSFPYTRPVVRTFIERLARQYHDATGFRLVVTSLTRPTSRQPRNASPYSVHPTGIAVDFRVPPTASAREWLEGTLLALEQRGVLDATREKRPPHYHVAVFPDEYEPYVNARIADEVAERSSAIIEAAVRAAIAPRAAERPSVMRCVPWLAALFDYFKALVNVV